MASCKDNSPNYGSRLNINWRKDAKYYGLVAQTRKSGVEWIAWTPPKRQVEGSNPSGPASNLSVKLGPLIE